MTIRRFLFAPSCAGTLAPQTFNQMSDPQFGMFTKNASRKPSLKRGLTSRASQPRRVALAKVVERVAGLYGVRPSVEFVEIATLVENSRP